MYDNIIMNRSSSRDSLIAGRNHNATINGILPHRRSMPFSKSNSAENFNNNNNMDLFSRNRTSLPLPSSDESDLWTLFAILEGKAKAPDSPGTPLVPPSNVKESQPTPVTARSRSSVRSSSTNKTSRLSVSQSESSHPARPARSSSVTRPSVSSTQYTSYSSRNSNILNTSSASVSSYIRPSTPTNRSSTTTSRVSTPSTRTTPSRASTPSRTRPSPPTISNDRPTRPSQTSRPSTPSSRPQTPGSLTSPTVRPPSRPSTPTRRSLTPSLSPSTAPSASGGRGLSSNGRNVGSTSRPSSPSPRLRPPPQPINLPDFPHETPPNLRTTLPDRPLSAGRSRPSAKGNVETTSNTASITRRHSSPVVSRGRIAEPPGRGRPHANGHVVESLEGRRISQVPDSLTRRPIKSSNSENGTGFGRNISKKSLDMAIKHMDIRNGGARPLSGSTLFPQSIRSANSRTQPGRAMSAPGSVDGSVNGENGNYAWNRAVEDHQSPHSSKLSSEVDIYESSRYDAILLKEDLKNTSWLHSADDKIDEGPLFDNGFETLPEPFGPLV
ncbi:hypothetical protein OSB04_024422 [Centaurea solstitialis]|uniref:Uncharacterized protein n=1 Tax=Centaurea solstitialis TaxID=347529 RepID=A0AA38WAB5_9ASTR|nr:hypothetical protein OSB04_024422 [Centaurea solstitialis]